MAGPAIELRVEKRYGGHAAPAGVSLCVQPGELSPPWSADRPGKTTLPHTINRLVTPDAGAVRVPAKISHRLAAQCCAARSAMFREVGLFPAPQQAENIATTPKLLGWDKKRIDVARR
jgi:osmoprotectant transport system ATP-binding protein